MAFLDNILQMLAPASGGLPPEMAQQLLRQSMFTSGLGLLSTAGQPDSNPFQGLMSGVNSFQNNYMQLVQALMQQQKFQSEQEANQSRQAYYEQQRNLAETEAGYKAEDRTNKAKTEKDRLEAMKFALSKFQELGLVSPEEIEALDSYQAALDLFNSIKGLSTEQRARRSDARAADAAARERAKYESGLRVRDDRFEAIQSSLRRYQDAGLVSKEEVDAVDSYEAGKDLIDSIKGLTSEERAQSQEERAKRADERADERLNIARSREERAAEAAEVQAQMRKERLEALRQKLSKAEGLPSQVKYIREEARDLMEEWDIWGHPTRDDWLELPEDIRYDIAVSRVHADLEHLGWKPSISPSRIADRTDEEKTSTGLPSIVKEKSDITLEEWNELTPTQQQNLVRLLQTKR